MIRIIPILSLIVFCSVLSVYSFAQDEKSLSKADVTQMIESYIKENPQVIIDSLQQHEITQREEEEAQAAEKLNTHEDYLKTGDLPRVGNPDGDIKIVEFYDYNCGYCKKAFTDLQILLQADPNVEVTLVEMPILGESSLEAAKWSTAAANQEKFFNYHGAIMSFSGQKDEANLRTLAESSGIDVALLAQNAKDPAVVDTIEKNINVARDIGIRGTPGFIINGEIYRGYLGYDGLKAVIDEIRMSNKDAATPEAEKPTDTPAG